MSSSTFGQKAADFIKKLVGSWPYVIGFNLIFTGWIIINELEYHTGSHPFDPYPFILLNLFLSYLAGVTGPLIMVSQNRQEQIQSQQEELQRQTLVSVMHMLQALNEMLREQRDVLERLDDNSEEILEAMETGEDDAAD